MNNNNPSKISKYASEFKKNNLAGLTTVYQSNKISNKKFKGFSVIHNRLFLYIIQYYQNYIKNAINQQLSIAFDSIDKDYLEIPIELNKIVSQPNKYKDIYLAAQDILDQKISRNVQRNDEVFIATSHIFTEVLEPVIKNRKSVMYVIINKSIFKEILDVFDNGKLGYTQYYFEVAFNSRNKYLPKLYQYLASYENLGKKRISQNNLLELLGIDVSVTPTFKNISEINKKILEPIKKDLYSNAKFFFNYSWTLYKTKNEYFYDFIIINRDELLKIDNQINILKELCNKIHFELFNSIFPLIQNCYSSDLINKINLFMVSVNDNNLNNIKNPLLYYKKAVENIIDESK